MSEAGIGEVVAVARDGAHRFSKLVVAEIELVAGIGVAGDAHAGVTVRHRSRVRADPSQPNLRQVHLIHAELFDQLAALGFDGLRSGELGENVLTRGLALLDLPRGARLLLGEGAVIEITGLRNPCAQLDGLRSGLMRAVLDRAPDGSLIRKAGVMAIVVRGGRVRPGDPVSVTLPEPPFAALDPV
jgi:MOSC domain-containing protein YiiM